MAHRYNPFSWYNVIVKLIVGLGNPGEKYTNSRHNLGFITLDHLLQKLTKLKNTYWEEDKKFKALTHEIDMDGEKVVLMKPSTFMNDSGRAVSSYIKYFKIDPQDIVVLHDELDMPLGKIRIRFGGYGCGHKCVSSIIDHVGTDKFLRIRMGIGKEARREGVAHDTSDYVLGIFTSNEKGKVNSMVKQAIKDILLIQKHGIELYMSKYNKGSK